MTVALILGSAAIAYAQDRSNSVKLDFDHGTISPGDPTINLSSRPSVVIEILPAGKYSIYPTGWKSWVHASLSPLLASPYLTEDLKDQIRQTINNPAKYEPSRLMSILTSTSNSLAKSSATLTAASATASAGSPSLDAHLLAETLPMETANGINTNFKAATSVEAKKKVLDAKAAAIAGDKSTVDQVAAAATPGDRAVLNFVAGSKDEIGHTDGEWSWTVTMKSVTRDYPVDVVCESISKEGKDAPCPRPHMVAVIHVETATYDFSWSAGLAVTTLRDARYRIDKNSDPTKDSALVANGHEGYPYQLATSINYCLAKPTVSWLCPATVGVSTDVPVDKLTILLGPAVRFRPLDIKNAFYLSAGLSYGTRKVLNDDYAGRSTVPPSVTTSSIYTDKRSFGAYVGVTFGFLGSSSQFTGVFSGSKNSSDTAKASPSK
jgi:hypothetical protein